MFVWMVIMFFCRGGGGVGGGGWGVEVKGMFLCLLNGPFAASGHMVQNPSCWRASYALGHPKQRKCKFVLIKSLSSMADFVPCDR